MFFLNTPQNVDHNSTVILLTFMEIEKSRTDASWLGLQFSAHILKTLVD